MEALHQIVENYNIPILTAFILGLMTAISPCPLATNITATAYISRNISDKSKAFLSGALYSLGRGFSYTMIGVVLYLGASKFQIALFFSQNGEKYLGPLLIMIGLIMMNVIRIKLLQKTNLTEKISERFQNKGILGSFAIGIVFSLAFCPYSGALFFGMLVPISISSVDGLYLPLIFALGTGLPVILFTYLLAFTVGKVGIFYRKITTIEHLMRKIAGIVFLITGLYYVFIFMNLV